MPTEDLRRRIPQIARLLDRPAIRAVIADRGRPLVERAIQTQIAELRALAAEKNVAAFDRALLEMDERVVKGSESAAAHSLTRVINGTGVVVHTNLGRAPLSREVAKHVADIASCYSNLEFDLDEGERGHRETHAEGRLQAMLSAESSVVVNNNAAAVLLAVNTFAEGREVLVSRGELVEIGGSFRIPDIVRKGGARLREVGTTNRTRIGDYANAITPETGLILRVHPSNFRIVGFTEAASLKELVALGRTRSVPVVEDLGSGLLEPMPEPLNRETTIAESLAAGADVVTASGDKLLGGPQAGLLMGRRKAVDALRRNPLYRALRVDKMTIAALDAVLALHEAGRREALPVPRMLVMPVAEMDARARRLRHLLVEKGVRANVEVIDTSSAVGGGAAPDIELPSRALAIRAEQLSAAALLRKLRQWTPPIVARIEDEWLILDLRTILPDDETDVEQALLSLLRD